MVPARKGSVVPWIALGGTLGFGVATAALGGLTLSAKSTLGKDLDTFPGNPDEIESDRSKARRLAAAADVLGGITAAGAIATVVLFVTMPVTSTPGTWRRGRSTFPRSGWASARSSFVGASKRV